VLVLAALWGLLAQAAVLPTSEGVSRFQITSELEECRTWVACDSGQLDERPMPLSDWVLRAEGGGISPSERPNGTAEPQGLGLAVCDPVVPSAVPALQTCWRFTFRTAVYPRAPCPLHSSRS
jgi:hypothetical protein